MTWRVPAGVVGLQGTAATFERLESELGPLPSTWRAADDDGMEIRFFRLPAEMQGVTPWPLAERGLVVLEAGAEIDMDPPPWGSAR